MSIAVRILNGARATVVASLILAKGSSFAKALTDRPQTRTEQPRPRSAIEPHIRINLRAPKSIIKVISIT